MKLWEWEVIEGVECFAASAGSGEDLFDIATADVNDHPIHAHNFFHGIREVLALDVCLVTTLVDRLDVQDLAVVHPRLKKVLSQRRLADVSRVVEHCHFKNIVFLHR